MARQARANVQVSGADCLRELAGRLRPLTEKVVRVGMQGDAELAMIAGVHEFGSVKMNIPARSFIGTGKKKSRAAIGKLVRAGVTEIAFGRQDVDSLLHDIGRVGLDKTRKNFNRIKQPPLTARYAVTKIGRKLLQRDKDLAESLTYDVIPKERQ